MISELRKSNLKEVIYNTFSKCRTQTLALFDSIDEATLCYQAHPDFSPVGWHFGHIAYTESLWLLERSALKPCLFPQYRKLFAADGLPKNERVKLPTSEEIRYYLDTVREKVLFSLEDANLEQEERLWRFLLQHESQHSEIITFVLELVKTHNSQLTTHNSQLATHNSKLKTHLAEMIEIPAGEFEMGDDSIDALDNERGKNKVYLETYWIDRYPVTCGQYRTFMQTGGYQDSRWWTSAGWEWVQTNQVTQPLYWKSDRAWDDHPVCGVSWYEADAYARFVGKRLPTEAEWEKAVSWDAKAHRRRIYPWGDEEPTLSHCNHNNVIKKTTPVDTYATQVSAYGLYDALGNVWEWTSSWFDRYPGFQSYPYIGYSQVYFDNQHRVLKGGSWASGSWTLRSSFRNWYHPGVRQIFAGFRTCCGE